MAEPALAYGQKYAVKERFDADLTIEFFSGEPRRGRCTLTTDFRFEVCDIPDPAAPAVTVRPLEEDRWEPVLIPAGVLSDPLYRGYELKISRDNLQARCKRL
jgi:hypothetical protein